MKNTIITNSFNTGEVTPKMWGRTDFAKSKNAATTMRNFFVDYRGGAASRAGTAYIGMCKQGAPNVGGTATTNPPRDIPFQFNIYQGYVLEFGDLYMRIKSEGAYVIESAKGINTISQANPAILTIPGHGFSVGDWIFITGVVGPTSLNGLTWVVSTVIDANRITIADLFNTTLNSTSLPAYVSGGTASRIYTVVSPYAAIDLPYLKFTQSADVMSLTCVNQLTGTEYPPYDLSRAGNTSWSFTAVDFGSNIAPPTNVAITAQNSTTVSTWYSYVVTAVDAATGQESIASDIVSVENNDIAINAGSNTITWGPVTGASHYNVYEATPAFDASGIVVPPIGGSFGFAGTTRGLSFTDTNIIPDFTTTPPIHTNPFARNAIVDVVITAGGSGYTQGTVGYSVTTSTGTDFIGTPIVLGGAVVGFLIVNGGQGYAPGDTITITDSGGGMDATATLTLGPATGTYPGDVAYYQQRRVYADTLNEPDTYFMSQTGAYLNMDSSIPSRATDAIIGTPWAQQINGIQFMIPMQTGLIIFTGNSAWLVNGGSTAAITPASQTAVAESYNGCNATVPPIVIDYDILYVQSKGSIVCDLAYNFLLNVFTGSDRTTLSSQLFEDHSIIQWAWAREPNKLIWATREDGIMLSMTYLKEQEIFGWSRHDTNGLFIGVCSITERSVANVQIATGQGPLSDAMYIITQRNVNGFMPYYAERMDDRLWSDSESCWCVDAALAYPHTYPDAVLTASAATGDDIELVASASVFSSDNVGDVIRMGGGIITVTSFVSPTQVMGAVTQSISDVILTSNPLQVIPQISGQWSIATPVSSISGLNHLEGFSVTGLADGNVIPLTTVVNGTIELEQPASAIVIGLAFLPQLQSMYLDPPVEGGTAQGRRTTVNSVAIRYVLSRGFSYGANQIDASTQQNQETFPWDGMIEIKQNIISSNPTNSIPLATDDYYANIQAGWDPHSQVAIQQNYPLPCNISCLIYFCTVGE